MGAWIFVLHRTIGDNFFSSTVQTSSLSYLHSPFALIFDSQLSLFMMHIVKLIFHFQNLILLLITSRSI